MFRSFWYTSGYRDENHIKWSGDGTVSRDDVMFWASPVDLQGFSKFIVYKYSGKVQYKTTSSTHAHSFVGVIYTVFIVHSYSFLQHHLKSMHGEQLMAEKLTDLYVKFP